MSDMPRREEEPTTKLGHLANDMMKLLDPHEGVTGIVMLHEGRDGMAALHGYEDDAEAVADLFLYLKSIMEANGKTMLLLPMEGPSPS